MEEEEKKRGVIKAASVDFPVGIDNTALHSRTRACLLANYLNIRAFVFTSSVCDVKDKDPRVAAATAAAGVYPEPRLPPPAPPSPVAPARRC